MKDKNEFYSLLMEIDGRELGELGRLLGDYDFNRFVIKAAPAIMMDGEPQLPVIVRVTHAVSGFPDRFLSAPISRVALEDFLTRKIAEAIDEQGRFDSTGLARRLIVRPAIGQKILPRSTVQVADDYTDVRLRLVIPMQRGRLDAATFQHVFFQQLPSIVKQALLYCNMNQSEAERFASMMEDADEIRRSLAERGFAAFVADGALVHRRHGTDLPDAARRGIAVDPSLLQTFDTANSGAIRGAGIPPGVTLILGDASEGRTDLLRAIAAGIYNHVPGDGREMVVSMPDAVYVASEPGRPVQRVDLACFLGSHDFSSESAGQLESQSASLIESIEAGARVIVLDEADSAPGFLGGDSRLGAISGLSSSLAPLASRARQMVEELGISTIVGGQHAVGSFIPVADAILLLDRGVLRNVTAEVKQGWTDKAGGAASFDFTGLVETARWIVPSSIDAASGLRDSVIEVAGAGMLRFGSQTICLGNRVQLADDQQLLTLGLIIEYALNRYLEQPRPIRELLDLIERDLSTEGLDQITRDLRGDLARPRRYEIAAALNRLPSLRVVRAAL